MKGGKGGRVGEKTWFGRKRFRRKGEEGEFALF